MIIEWFRKIFCKDLIQEISDANKTIEKLEQQLTELQKKYDEDCKYYEDRINTLTQQLLKSIEMPDLSEFVSKVKLIEPRSLIWNVVPNSTFADWNYYTLPLDDWKKVLTKIQQTFKAVWTQEIFDCDDFALLTSAMLTYAWYKSIGNILNNQLAFGIAWSKTHAYNVFIDNDRKVWIYEPQSNIILGELGKTQAPYDTIEIWFMS